MADKCPYCFRPLGTHTHDPILLPNGSKYKFSDDTHLEYVPNIEDRIYRGVYQISEPEVQELQDALKILEIQNLDVGDRTTFSPLNTSGKFQITGKHIKEMRDSIEKLLTAMGITKTEYFNYDEEFNHIIHPNGDKVEWTDPITSSTDLLKFQVKGIHIEDLRHYIRTLWIETWNSARIDPLDPYSKLNELISFDTSGTPPTWWVDGTTFHLYADKNWYSGTHSTYISATGYYSSARGHGFSQWDIQGTEDKYFNYLGDITLETPIHHLDSWAFLIGESIINTNINWQCNPLLRLEIEHWTKSIIATPGTSVIVEPGWWNGGIWYDTVSELNSRMLNALIGGTIEIRVYFDKHKWIPYSDRDFYVSFYYQGERDFPIPLWSTLWNPDSNYGMSLYNAVLTHYGYVSPDDFAANWHVTSINVYHSTTTRTVWVGYVDWGGAYHVMGYTTNATLRTEYTLDNIRLMTRTS